uniref:Uncharacterized protein n=1 Tax=Oryza glumipatula TaxID=40148 RepID=A0A0D9ZKR6_9ORYZ
MAHEENCEGELFQTEGPRLLAGFSIIWLSPYVRLDLVNAIGPLPLLNDCGLVTNGDWFTGVLGLRY